MIDLIIRRAASNDAETLVQFNLSLARETEDRELSEDIVKLGVQRLLGEPERGFYFVAEQAGQVIGALLITFEWSDWRNANFWWIQSVYVHKDFRRRGIYRRLYEHVYQLAKQSGEVCGLRLYVEKENLNAQQTYVQLGMADSGYKVFEAAIGR